MTLDPAQLSELSRAQLIERARAVGVVQPEPLTRAELQDEIVRRGEQDERRRRILRGWFGVARDLVASLVDQGLNLPEAAKVIRGSDPPEAELRKPVATVTLAEIFAAQGHVNKALRILSDVLAVESDHEVARRLHERLLRDEAAQAAPPQPEPATEPEAAAAEPAPAAEPAVADESAVAAAAERAAAAEPAAAAADGEGEEQDALDQEEIVPVERDAAFARVRNGEVAIYWELSAEGIERAQERWPGARPIVRLVTVAPDLDGPCRKVRDMDIESTLGSLVVGGVEPGAVTRAAVGWQSGGDFVPAVVAAELAEDDTLDWTPWGFVPSETALARAAALLSD